MKTTDKLTGESHPSQVKAGERTVLLLGLPNSGKTTLFNNLTGEYGIVANYLFTTVEPMIAGFTLGEERFKVVDLPGITSVIGHSEDEREIRSMIYRERDITILLCLDIGRLKQGLVLTAELLEFGLPMAICLNAIDEEARSGVTIDAGRLSASLGVAVVETVAVRNEGTEELKHAVATAAVSPVRVRPGKDVEELRRSMMEGLGADARFPEQTALILLQGDSSVRADAMGTSAASGKSTAGTGSEARGGPAAGVKSTASTGSSRSTAGMTRKIAKARNVWVDELYFSVVRETDRRENAILIEFARLSRHPVWGFPILLLFLTVMYLLVVDVAAAASGLLEILIVEPSVRGIEHLLPAGPLRDSLVGDYGVLTLGLFNAVVTVLPILSVFFLLFGFMEDLGYLPNLTILVKRTFEKIGLTGKSVMPLVLGFGCKTMATLMTKSISSRKEKLIAVFLIAFALPCSAQLALNIAILGNAGLAAFVIAVIFLVLVEIGAGAVLHRLIPEDSATSFIQELPPFRMPDPVAVLRKTAHRLLFFLKESIPIFVLAAVALFLFDLAGGLDALKVFLRPAVVTWLGLPIDMVDALILTMARHEAAAGLILRMSDQGRLTVIQSIVAVVITTMFVPCFANIAAMIRQVGAKTGAIMTITINVSSFLLAGLLNFLLLLFSGGGW